MAKTWSFSLTPHSSRLPNLDYLAAAEGGGHQGGSGKSERANNIARPFSFVALWKTSQPEWRKTFSAMPPLSKHFSNFTKKRGFYRANFDSVEKPASGIERVFEYRQYPQEIETREFKPRYESSFLPLSPLQRLTSSSPVPRVGDQPTSSFNILSEDSAFRRMNLGGQFFETGKMGVRNGRLNRGQGVDSYKGSPLHGREWSQGPTVASHRLFLTAARFQVKRKGHPQFLQAGADPFSDKGVSPFIDSGALYQRESKNQIRDFETLEKQRQTERQKAGWKTDQNVLTYISAAPLSRSYATFRQGDSQSVNRLQAQKGTHSHNPVSEDSNLAVATVGALRKNSLPPAVISTVADKVYSILLSRIKREQELRRR